jgi:glutaminyl-peptide cyclotransferase
MAESRMVMKSSYRRANAPTTNTPITIGHFFSRRNSEGKILLNLASLPCFFVLFLLLAATGFAAPTQGYKVIHVYPHDANAFTQGLIYLDGALYEGTGLNGHSSIRMVDLTSGRVLQRYDLPQEYFGEGITNWGSNLYELTWTSNKCFVYDRFSFRLLKTFTYSGEGWGLTHDKTSLIMSDGTAYLRFLNPNTFAEIKRIEVTDNGRPVTQLNELEYIHGEIYANIWQTDRIVRISPVTGKVLGWIDMTGVLPAQDRSSDDAVLNGIAYDEKGDRLFITGKLWPKLFEIKLKPAASH